MPIIKTTSIECDDPDHENGRGCTTVTGDNLSDARGHAAVTYGWTTNGKRGKDERWYCTYSNTPWCAKACGRPAYIDPEVLETGDELCRKCEKEAA